MKSKLILAGLFLLSVSCFADTIRDSAITHDAIVNTVNPIITAIPDANPGVSIIKVVLLSIGSAITGACIAFFGKRNAKKNKG